MSYRNDLLCDRCGAVGDSGNYPCPPGWVELTTTNKQHVCNVCAAGLWEYVAGGKVVPKPFLDRMSVESTTTTIQRVEDSRGRVG